MKSCLETDHLALASQVTPPLKEAVGVLVTSGPPPRISQRSELKDPLSSFILSTVWPKGLSAEVTQIPWFWVYCEALNC